MHGAKSMLGGSLDKKMIMKDDTPGPGQYNNFPVNEPPGFKIEIPKGKSAKEVDKTKEPVGPQKYDPFNPNHMKSDHQTGQTFGKALRQDLIEAVNVPGPGKYNIDGDFEKALTKPKFHMGDKLQGFAGKNMDQPGPGEYETDVIPIHHSHVAHFIGTSVRSDLGVGKAYMYPGPGDYEAQIDP